MTNNIRHAILGPGDCRRRYKSPSLSDPHRPRARSACSVRRGCDPSPAVLTELTNESTPATVRSWLANTPEWLRVQVPRETLRHLLNVIGDGEREAIALAVEVGADALLMDDRDARRHAEALKCQVIGTLRVLADASEHGFAELQVALDRLRSTNFRADNRLFDQILSRSRK